MQKGKKFKSTSKTFHLPPFVYVDFRLWATANENKYHFWKISGTTGFRLNHCFTESQSKKSYFFRVPRVLPGDPPLTEEPANSGLEIVPYRTQFRIVIRFNCSAAETRLWFRRRAIVAPWVVPNSGFTEAKQQLVSGDEAKTMAPLPASFSRLLLTSSINYCKTREEDGRKACRKHFAFTSKPSAIIASLSPDYSCFLPKIPLQYDPVDDYYYDTILRMVWIFIEHVQWCQVQEDIPCIQGNLQVYSLPHLSTQFAMGVFCGQNFEREHIDVLLNKLLLCLIRQNSKIT